MIVGVTDNNKAELQSLFKFMSAQSRDSNCRAAFDPVRKTNSRVNFDSDGVLLLVSLLSGTLQGVVPFILRACVLHAYDYSILPGHSGEHPMYDPMRKKLYWPELMKDVFNTVRD